MSKAYIPTELRRQIEAEAGLRCGYCLSAQNTIGVRLHLEHIIPLVAGGETVAGNLWLACPLCNSYKGTQTEAVDPETSELVTLFNPRTQIWKEHFTWSAEGTVIVGITSVGRATVIALRLNNEYVLPARRVWVAARWHPPTD